MSDRTAVVLAACAWSGAWLAVPLPWWVAVPGVVAGLLTRRPAVVAIGIVLVVDVLAVRALDGLDPPPEGELAEVITLVTDPEPTADGRLRFEASTSVGRLLAEVRSPVPMEALQDQLAGDRARVRGRSGSFRRPSEWTRSRHLAGTLRVEAVEGTGAAAPPAAAANAYRRLLDRGAASLEPAQRSLLAGLVLGDDRAQPPELTADFRAAGLTHLLAVSGQNVAFVLVVVGPLLRRMRIWPRFLLAVSVIAAFALVTRFEASVLRAAVVAGVALFATTTGRASGGVRHLALAVCLLLVIDPLLVHSLAFRLSVAASAGVLVIAPRVAERLPGPRWCRDGASVTVGAQLAVAPVLIPVLGPMPLAALPANILAGPLAGLLMVWGLVGGTAAGVLGERVAWVLHRPSALGLDALDRIAAVGASLPLGTIDLRHVALLAAAAIAARAGGATLRVGAAALTATVLLAPVLTPVADGPRRVGPDATVFVDGRVAVVEVGARADPADVVESLRDARVVAVGMIVVRSARPAAVAATEAIGARFPVGGVVAPPGVDGAVVPPPGFRAGVGRIGIVVDRVGPPLRARVHWRDDEPGQTSAVGSPGAPPPGSPSIRHVRTGRRGRAGQHLRRRGPRGRSSARCHRPAGRRRPGAGARTCRCACRHDRVRLDPGRRRFEHRRRRSLPRPPPG